MNVKAIRSYGIYAKIMTVPDEKKTDIFRYKMTLLKQKWDYYHIPQGKPYAWLY